MTIAWHCVWCFGLVFGPFQEWTFDAIQSTLIAGVTILGVFLALVTIVAHIIFRDDPDEIE